MSIRGHGKAPIHEKKRWRKRKILQSPRRFSSKIPLQKRENQRKMGDAMGKNAKHWTPELEEVRAWLKMTGVSRAELAVKIGVTRHTIDNYLSGHTPIPARVRARILAHKEYIPPQTRSLKERCRVVGAPLTGAEYADVLSAAMKSNYTVEELCSAAIVEFSRAILTGSLRLPAPTRSTVQ